MTDRVTRATAVTAILAMALALSACDQREATASASATAGKVSAAATTVAPSPTPSSAPTPAPSNAPLTTGGANQPLTKGSGQSLTAGAGSAAQAPNQFSGTIQILTAMELARITGLEAYVGSDLPADVEYAVLVLDSPQQVSAYMADGMTTGTARLIEMATSVDSDARDMRPFRRREGQHVTIQVVGDMYFSMGLSVEGPEPSADSVEIVGG